MAAAIVLLVARGRSVRDWLGQIFRIGPRPSLYLVALLLPIAALVVAGGVHATLLGGEVTPAELPALYESPIFLFVVLVIGGGQEEPGWRGYLLPTLQERYSPLRAALLVGVVWTIWHVPLFFAPETIQSDIAFWLYAPQVIAMSVVLTWLTNAAAGSVLPAMLLHAGANAIVNYYPVGGAVGATSITGYGLLTSVVVVVALALVARHGTDLGGGDPPSANRPTASD